jgi:hypothetical protein
VTLPAVALALAPRPSAPPRDRIVAAFRVRVQLGARVADHPTDVLGEVADFL